MEASHLLEAAFVAANPESQLIVFGTEYTRLCCCQHAVIVKQDGAAVFQSMRIWLSLRMNKASDSLRHAECMNNLVYEMGS